MEVTFILDTQVSYNLHGGSIREYSDPGDPSPSGNLASIAWSLYKELYCGKRIEITGDYAEGCFTSESKKIVKYGNYGYNHRWKKHTDV